MTFESERLERKQERRWDRSVFGTLLIVQIPIIFLFSLAIGIATMRLMVTIGGILYVLELAWHIWADTRRHCQKPKTTPPANQCGNGEQKKDRQSRDLVLVDSFAPE